MELSTLEAGNFWFKARNALILDAIDDYVPARGDFLEIGCGTGFVLGAIAREYPGMRCQGSEIFVEGLEIAARRLPQAGFMQMDARHIPFVDHFDAIGAFDVLEHVTEDEEVLQQVRSALRADGRILLTVPQHPWLWSVQDEYAHHVRRYQPRELEDKLRRNGFRVIFSTSFVALLLPALAASRLVKGNKAREQDPFREFRLPGWLNRTLGGIMAVERFLIRMGVRFPIGGTRLIVAEKIPA
ncbi:class I SAM-dependent methyltransferase [Thermomonas sp.]|uniref:class I SAM-dependent methyltransferase n=1 Tax=Thermomonas sp. TaxID=1971895 RepID=UPI002486DE65|nr:class I SAM-dependent methyltransferase [Thermomonas sp.]MDI1254207.1 class I SAM-dependent methyltransferase [Thermomonas sp.]